MFMMLKAGGRKILLFLMIGIILISLVGKVTAGRKDQLVPPCSKCNIVVLDIDVSRADAIDCSSRPGLTPNLCAVAKRAINFKNHVSHSDTTRSSFVSALTSLYPTSHGMWSPFNPSLNPQTESLLGLLQKNGYRTISMAKFKTPQLPFEWFDEYVNFTPWSAAATLGSALRWQQPFLFYIYSEDLHFPYLLSESDAKELNDPRYPAKTPKTWQEFNNAIADYLVEHYREVFKPEAIAANPEVFANNISEHKQELLELFEKYSIQTDRQLGSFLFDDWLPRYKAFMRFIDVSNPDHVHYLWTRYLLVLKRVDSELGELFKQLEKAKFSRPTIVVVRSDHGEEFYEHGSLGHQNNLYQELIHTPLVIKIPGVKGKTINQLTQDIDLLPTLLELIGIDVPDQAQGQSLLPLINHPEKGINTYQLAQKDGDTASFRKEDWKLIIVDSEPFGLYNLAADPREKINLLRENPVKVKELFRDYRGVIEKQKNYSSLQPPFPGWLEETKRQRLQKEGYF